MEAVPNQESQVTKPTGSLVKDLMLMPSTPDLELTIDAPLGSVEGSESCSQNSDNPNDYNSDSSYYSDDGLYNDETLSLQAKLDAVDLPPGIEASIPWLEESVQGLQTAPSNTSTISNEFSSQGEKKTKEKAKVWWQQPFGSQFKVPAPEIGVKASIPGLEQPVQSAHTAVTNSSTISTKSSSYGEKEMKDEAEVWCQSSGAEASIPWLEPPVQGVNPAATISSTTSSHLSPHGGKTMKGKAPIWQQQPVGNQFKLFGPEFVQVHASVPWLEQPVQSVQPATPIRSTVSSEFNSHSEKEMKGKAEVWWQQPFGSKFQVPAPEFGGIEASIPWLNLPVQSLQPAAPNRSTISGQLGNLSTHIEKEVEGEAEVWWQQPFGNQFKQVGEPDFGGVEASIAWMEQPTEGVHSATIKSSMIPSKVASHDAEEMKGKDEVSWQQPFGSHLDVPTTMFGGVDASIPLMGQHIQAAHLAAANSLTISSQLSSQSGKKKKGRKAQTWQQQKPFANQFKMPAANFVEVEASIPSPWSAQPIQPHQLPAISESMKMMNQVSFHDGNIVKGNTEVWWQQQPFGSQFMLPTESIYPSSSCTEKGKEDGLQHNSESHKEAAAATSSSIDACQWVSSSRHELGEDEILEKFRLFKQFDIVQDHSDHHFIHWATKSTQAQRNWMKTIQQEWNSLEKDLPGGIFVRVYEERMDLLRAVIVGPAGTPYEAALFFFDVFFTYDYPNVPPKVFYYSGGLRLNPNLYCCGKVCLSLLNTWHGDKDERWIPGKSTMLQLLLSIQALVLNDNPYYNEPGYEAFAGHPQGEAESKSYNENAFILSCKTMLYILKRPPKHFEVFVAGHFRENAHAILLAFKARAKDSESGVFQIVSKKHIKSGANSEWPLRLDFYMILQKLVQEFTSVGAKDCDQFLCLENW